VVVTVSFSEPVNPLTVDETSIILQDQTTGQIVVVAVAANATGTVATAVPEALLLSNTVYRLQVANVMDKAGKSIPVTGIFFTTGE